MAINYTTWSVFENPPRGTFTATLINHGAGAVVVQTESSPTHILPRSYLGKGFGIQNSSRRTFSVRMNGIDIPPGQAAIFLWSGTRWDFVNDLPGLSIQTLPDGPGRFAGNANALLQVDRAGDALTFIPIDSVQNHGQYGRTIHYSDAADQSDTVYSIGRSLPANCRIERLVVETVTPFNDRTGYLCRVRCTSGFTQLQAQSENDLKTVGVYVRELPATQIRSGQVRVIFNAPPRANGGTAGVMRVYVQYGLL